MATTNDDCNNCDEPICGLAGCMRALAREQARNMRRESAACVALREPTAGRIVREYARIRDLPTEPAPPIVDTKA